MPDPEAITRSQATVKLALLDAFTAGAALGFLAHLHREALMTHSTAIGLGMVIFIGVILLLRAGFHTLHRANRRLDAIFRDELDDRRQGV